MNHSSLKNRLYNSSKIDWQASSFFKENIMGVAHTDHGGTIVKCLNGNGRYHDGKQCGKCKQFRQYLGQKNDKM